MKKIFLVALLALVGVGAHAQFDKGTSYLNASLSGLSMSYSKDARFKMGLEAQGGYFLEDAWMLYGRFGFQHQTIKGPDNNRNDLEVGVGGRYYIKQNGLYLGCGLMLDHASHVHLVYGYDATGTPSLTKMGNRNYLDLTPEIGYCFYLNHYVSIEPAIYYNLCLNHFSEGSEVGLKLGIGYYF